MEHISYEYLALVYDRLMEDVDYKQWTDFLVELLARSGKLPTHILELGCGTGNITRELLARGYEVVGIDRSAEMLEYAREKTASYGDRIILIEQDITELDFEVYEIDTVIAVNDTFNYISDIGALERLLRYLHPRLKQGGQLVFDISSEYKLAHVLGEQTYGESFDEMAYLWENHYDPAQRQVYMNINIFAAEGAHYVRYQEEHVQRAYSADEIIALLARIGYRNIEVYADFSLVQPVAADAERLFFSCVK